MVYVFITQIIIDASLQFLYTFIIFYIEYSRVGKEISIPESVMKKICISNVRKLTYNLMSHLLSIEEIASSFSRIGKKNKTSN